ncbi:Cruciform DNA-recognizing protein 1 [Sphaceloma murrayae]|uniref:Cruciform DNA-recognizing protein 1 n=1 Tax=Sphaceloma murrayae TaxID=2082308 RepID=A0A2K1QVQ6_9PEZI|nr:Cruciform DNA-recognizing protein 1 [Sphaceloma murrayae]
MGSYVFKWPHAASEVYVTGTFDGWSQSQKLEKVGSGFEKKVSLSDASEKIYYKFVVDGTWTTDHEAPSETDHSGNVNNVLKPEHILSSVSPSSTTAALASQVPLEKSGPSSELPGQFPETPANEPTSFSVNPIPATSGPGNPIKLAPGEPVPDPSTYTSNTVQSTVRDGQDLDNKVAPETAEQTFSVNPIPATAGAGNPIKLAPGEKVPDPSTYTSNTISSTVRDDSAFDTKTAAGAPQLPPVLSKQEEAEAGGAAIFGVGPVASNIIPESSLPMGPQSGKGVDDPTTNSVGPTSTTAQMAGQQPIEPRGVPEVVTESQREAGAAPEASDSVEAIKEKTQVEEELKEKIPEAPSTSESGLLGKSEKGILGTAAAGVAAAGAAAAGAAYAAKDKVAGSQPEKALPQTVQDTLPASFTTQKQTNGVPEVVTESQHKAHADPEASASAEAVKEKAAMEKELEQKIKPSQESGVPGSQVSGVPGVVTESQHKAHVDPEASASAEAVQEKAAMEKELEQTVKPSQESGVPEIVTESQHKAHADPEASASSEAVQEKAAMEKELEQKVKPSQEAGEPAPTDSAATFAVAPIKPTTEAMPVSESRDTGRTLEPSPAAKMDDSRDVSPMTKPGEASVAPNQNQTTVTAGNPSTPQKKRTSSFFKKTPATPDSTTTPYSDTASPTASDAAKKNKRKSFFGKIKEKLKS